MIRHPRSMQGVGLIEVLITVVVLSVGLLGAGSLLASSLRVSQGSLQRTQAGVLANDILDRLRADPINARAGNFNIALGNAGAGDLAAWKTRITSVLPAGDGSVNCTANNPPANPSVCTVIIQWDDTRAGGDVAQQFSVVTRP